MTTVVHIASIIGMLLGVLASRATCRNISIAVYITIIRVIVTSKHEFCPLENSGHYDKNWFVLLEKILTPYSVRKAEKVYCVIFKYYRYHATVKGSVVISA